MTEDKAGTYNILRMLVRGKTKFSELLEYVPRQTLSARLRELEKSEYVERAILDSRPPRPEYSITPTGREMFQRMALERYRNDIDDVFLIAPMEAAQITDEYLKERKYQPKEGLVRREEADIPQAEPEKKLIQGPEGRKHKPPRHPFAIDEKEIGALQRLGLTEYEARLYLALLLSGPLSPSQLSFFGQVPRTKADVAIKELQRHGLLKVLSRKPEVYAPCPPAEVLPARIAKINSEVRESEKIIQALLEGTRRNKM
jgi:DNA-binding MarR family transcriptional regulator/predicted transcriptional regulator